MKQKLFENVGGNKFRLLTESKDNQTTLLRGGISKIFANAGKEVSYTMLENMGLGYIKDVMEAKKTALQEARELAEGFGFVDNGQKFVKEVGVSVIPEQSGTSEEKREVQIGKQILQAVSNVNAGAGSASLIADITNLANELIQMHTSNDATKKPLSGWDTLQLGSH